MEAILETFGQRLYINNNHKGYLIQWNRIAHLCKKWSKNRDPDLNRVSEICQFLNNNGYVPQIIHIAELLDEGVVCYDGNHRREVFNRCAIDVTCVVDVIFNASKKDVHDAFNSINKSIQLPAIYLEEHNASKSDIKDEIISLVKSYETKYKMFLSTSSRCHAPHFNRDALIDNINDIYHTFNGDLTIPQIGLLFEKLNHEYSKGLLCRLHSLYKPNVIAKCLKYNFWLFLERTIPPEHLERLVKISPIGSGG